jgi:hypothetical protein
LTLVHRSFTLAHMKLAVPEGGGFRDSSSCGAVAAGLTGARYDEIALYDEDPADPAHTGHFQADPASAVETVG